MHTHAHLRGRSHAGEESSEHNKGERLRTNANNRAHEPME
jgi:hypothetical protein